MSSAIEFLSRPPRRLLAVLTLLLCPWFGGCVATLNRAATGSDVTVAHDLAYGDDARQRLDVYRPVAPGADADADADADGGTVAPDGASAKRGLPVVVFLYGGSWQSGSKEAYPFVGAALARRGYVTFVPDYRIYPQVTYPAFVQDAARAVAYARAHAARYGGDPSRIVLIGHSAGAYLVAMLALDKRWLAAVGMDPQRDLRGVVGLAGPYDFLPLHDDALKAIFTTPAGLADTQPITHVDGASPPMLLLAGRNDKTVDPGNTLRLAAALRAHGAPVEDILYAHAAHPLIIGAFAPMLRFLSPSFADTTRFVDARVKP
ncbi:alpha/beta hydrolase [Robbsia sp. Bb-Pol-6]|uniref:Alpha/beta hydrolase n=1 Tax=Robbsia betulipollinis TaxID=2981849 RepID=A0ABT3ZHE9_9BURK|nr:alpha/beta hydrolase [Robbsia betulipollinis]MCY0385954.1 alpha/beta hydrolase [Robbsia betulipollinis]